MQVIEQDTQETQTLNVSPSEGAEVLRSSSAISFENIVSLSL